MSQQHSSIRADLFLVCGLGSFGQHCVSALQAFGVTVRAIDKRAIEDWEVSAVPDRFVKGDCRSASILEAAGVRQCRAVLLVTNDQNVNIESGFGARRLNPDIRLVVRSNKENLNELLGAYLGNFFAFEPTQLAADAFALAALGEETLGFARFGDCWVRAIARKIEPGEFWDRPRDRTLDDFNTQSRRLLCHLPRQRGEELREREDFFHKWGDAAHPVAGDTLIYLQEEAGVFRLHPPRRKPPWRERLLNFARRLRWRSVKQQAKRLWTEGRSGPRRAIVLASFFSVLLLGTGTFVFRLSHPDMRLRDAYNATLGLLLGGYPDVVGGAAIDPSMPLWLAFFGLGLTLAGTILIGIVYAAITEKLLAARFAFSTKRPPIPEADHVAIVGLGRVGRRTAAWLQSIGQPVVGIAAVPIDPDLLPPDLPFIPGPPLEAIAKANLNRAKSAIAVTEDEMENLELGLTAHRANPRIALAIRTYSQGFSDSLGELLPQAQSMCAYAVAAQAFAGAAFGEEITTLFHIGQSTTMVTEYSIEAEDTLNGLLLAEIAYGYGIAPLLLQKCNRDRLEVSLSEEILPSDDWRAEVGDRLVVLADIEGLKRVEVGDRRPPNRYVRLESARNKASAAEGARIVARISGCELSLASELTSALPVTLPFRLYAHQAYRLVRSLRRSQTIAQASERPFSEANGR